MSKWQNQSQRLHKVLALLHAHHRPCEMMYSLLPMQLGLMFCATTLVGRVWHGSMLLVLRRLLQ